ncbi:MAG: exodeoxyribonuclease VII large subunit, partial [Candidatus Cloacimonas sp.]|nr:exodeoxyribonuclease VII large subunit [Candidatus Cloacimonas sp.]
RCTFFKGANASLTFQPADGMQVICFGKLTVYEKGGYYNLNVQNMQEAGMGLLQQKFEQLKKKLEKEGLFAAEHKKPLPKYPDRIGIITSPTGAALKDIINIINRRYPVELIVYPALVQGSDAPPQIIQGIKYFNKTKDVDFIIITRGGGSQEDLFCFNDEALARAIYDSSLPVISAVGHEIDFTLADFVADLRAPTPSAAAELAVPDKKDLLNLLASLKKRLDLSVQNNFTGKRTPLLNLQLELAKYHPERVWRGFQQRFDMAEMALHNALKQLPEKRLQFEMKANNIMQQLNSRIELCLAKSKADCNLTWHQLNEKINNQLQFKTNRLNSLSEILEQLSPRSIQSKGWIMAFKEGKLISSIKQVSEGENLSLDFADGIAETTVNKVEKRE